MVLSLQSRDWEIIDDLQHQDQSSVPGSSLDLSIPGICEGYLKKKRKYPLNGWHKVDEHVSASKQSVGDVTRWTALVKQLCILSFQRYFMLEKGILKYSKTQQDVRFSLFLLKKTS